MYYPPRWPGADGDFLFVLDTMGMVWVWHKDGLYVGRLYHDTGAGKMDDQSIYGEVQRAAIWRDRQLGKLYSLVCAAGAGVHEVFLPTVERLAGEPVTVTGPQVAQARPWDPDGVPPTQRPTCNVYFAARPPEIEKGFDDQWMRLPDGQLRPEMLVLLDGQRLGSLRAMYDAKNLYLAYMVRDAVGPLNRGSELPYCPFVSGAYVDFFSRRTGPSPSAKKFVKAICGLFSPTFTAKKANRSSSRAFGNERPAERTRRPSSRPRPAFTSIRSVPCPGCE